MISSNREFTNTHLAWLTFLLLLPFTLLSNYAFAFPGKANEWQTRYEGATVHCPQASQTMQDIVDATGSRCQTCHTNSGGGEPWNAYGWAIRQAAGDLAAVEPLDSDANIGADTNLFEICVGTQPGWNGVGDDLAYFKDGTTQTATAPSVRWDPDNLYEPEIVGPRGLTTLPATFEWLEVDNATWYRVWVKDSTGSVVIKKWVKADTICNAVSDGVCTYSPGINTQGESIWQVRAYRANELGPYSERSAFWDASVSRPGATTLLSPLGVTGSSSPTFVWAEISDATWYKIEAIKAADDSVIIDQWLKASGSQVTCDASQQCSAQLPVFIGETFRWRMRTYNMIGLGPRTAYETVTPPEAAQ